MMMSDSCCGSCNGQNEDVKKEQEQDQAPKQTQQDNSEES
jgi:hypothetical protein